MIRVLGLDPGLRACGWGVIESNGNRLHYIAHGVIRPKPDQELAFRLRDIYVGICEVIQSYSPEQAAVEETFMNQNPASALKLGQARGIVLATPAIQGLSVAEYTANQIKKAVTGVGHCDKAQVQLMIKHLLPQAEKVTADAADALAVAICHSYQYPARRLA